MPKKEIKLGFTVAIAVIGAGFLMAHFANVPLIGTARSGFTG